MCRWVSYGDKSEIKVGQWWDTRTWWQQIAGHCDGSSPTHTRTFWERIEHEYTHRACPTAPLNPRWLHWKFSSTDVDIRQTRVWSTCLQASFQFRNSWLRSLSGRYSLAQTNIVLNNVSFVWTFRHVSKFCQHFDCRSKRWTSSCSYFRSSNLAKVLSSRPPNVSLRQLRWFRIRTSIRPQVIVSNSASQSNSCRWKSLRHWSTFRHSSHFQSLHLHIRCTQDCSSGMSNRGSLFLSSISVHLLR